MVTNLPHKDASALPALDGWRAIAILMVVFCHLRLPGNALSKIAPYGAVGVHLFFAISGFLITHRLLREHEQQGSVSLRGFYIRRAFRILPAAIAYLVALTVLGFVAGLIPIDAGQLTASLLFYRNYYVAPVAESWYTGHYWSLSVEEHFYLLWPALLIVIGAIRARWMVPMLALTFAIWRGLDTHFGWVATIDPDLRDLVERTDYRMDGLLWGCAAAFVWNAPAIRDWLVDQARSAHALAAIVLMGLCLFVQMPGYVALLAFLMPAPLLITTAHPSGKLGRLLEALPLAWLGRLSYSVYLWQMLFLPAYGLPTPLGWLQRFPLNLAAVLVCSMASYYWIETPLRRWGRKLADPLSPRTAASALRVMSE